MESVEGKNEEKMFRKFPLGIAYLNMLGLRNKSSKCIAELVGK